MPRGPARARRSQGQLIYTPSPGPRRPCCACGARRIPQFPLPHGGPVDAGLTCPSAGRLGTSLTGAGRVGEGAVIGLWLGGWLSRRRGVGRAIPEKVCRAGLGEQRAGGGPGMFADLFVTQSLLPGVSKAELQASPGRERTWGRGRRGLISVQPRGLGAAPRLQARAAVSLEHWTRATHQELPRKERDLRSSTPYQALGLAMSGRSAAT